MSSKYAHRDLVYIHVVIDCFQMNAMFKSQGNNSSYLQPNNAILKYHNNLNRKLDFTNPGNVLISISTWVKQYVTEQK